MGFLVAGPPVDRSSAATVSVGTSELLSFDTAVTVVASTLKVPQFTSDGLGPLSTVVFVLASAAIAQSWSDCASSARLQACQRHAMYCQIYDDQ
jgi:hypothetical protein